MRQRTVTKRPKLDETQLRSVRAALEAEWVDSLRWFLGHLPICFSLYFFFRFQVLKRVARDAERLREEAEAAGIELGL